MSFRMIQEAQEHAEDKLATVLDSSIALIRPKMVRWLNLLATNSDEATKNAITKDAFNLISKLIRKQELSVNAMVEVRMIYPDFDPEEHFGKVKRDEQGRVIEFIPANNNVLLTKDLLYATGVWKTAVRHKEFIDGIVKSLEVFADGLWELTGTALIKKITDYTGRTNYSVDRAVAGEIATEFFPDETEHVKDVEFTDIKEGKTEEEEK